MGVLYKGFVCPVCGLEVLGVLHHYSGEGCPEPRFYFDYKHADKDSCRVELPSAEHAHVRDILESSLDVEVVVKRLLSFWRGYLNAMPELATGIIPRPVMVGPKRRAALITGLVRRLAGVDANADRIALAEDILTHLNAHPARLP